MYTRGHHLAFGIRTPSKTVLILSIIDIIDRIGKGFGMRVTSTEFQQNVGRYQDAAIQAPVVITKHNRPHTVLMSAA